MTKLTKSRLAWKASPIALVLFSLVFVGVPSAAPDKAGESGDREIDIASLEHSIGPFEQFFNQAKDRPRFVTVLSPT